MNLIKKHFMFLICLSILLLTILSGCSDADTPSALTTTQNTMNMYVKSYDSHTLAAIKAFNTINKVQIHPSIIADDQIANDEYLKKITTEISVGEGPDILLDSAFSFPALNKIAESQVFCDLDKYINADKQLKLSDFYSKVMDCGVFNEKRYYIPLNFNIFVLWSSNNFLHKYNVSIDDSKWTLKDLHDIETEYIKNKNTKKYLISTDFYVLMHINWDNYINMAQKEAKFDSKNFIHLLDEYKTIYPSILDFSKLKRPELFFKYMKNDSLLFAYGGLSPEDVWSYNTAVNKILNSQIKLFLHPGISGNNHPAGTVNEFIAINNSSKNKQEAFNFIKLLLSEEYQNTWLPVNKKAFKSLINKYSGDNGNNSTEVFNYIPDNEPRYTSIPLSDNICNQINNYIENMDTCAYVDTNILLMINEEVASFIQGKHTSAQTAKIINDRVSIYLNE
jgi:multiple sugar transport system substrate-binding protein